MVFGILLQVVPPSTEDSHLITEPVSPERLREPEFEPEHTVVFAETVPPTLAASTVTVAAEEKAVAQVPLLTTALYWVFCVIFVKLLLLVVLAIAVQVAPPSMEYSQFCTEPVFPLSESVPEFEPLQTVWLLETDPPTDTGSTVMVAGDEFALEQLPFLTTAL